MVSHVNVLRWHRCVRFLKWGLPCPYGRPPRSAVDNDDDERQEEDPHEEQPTPPGVPAPILEPTITPTRYRAAAEVFTGVAVREEVLRLYYEPKFRTLPGDVLWNRVQEEVLTELAVIPDPLLPAPTPIVEPFSPGRRGLEPARVPAPLRPIAVKSAMAAAAEVLLSEGLAEAVSTSAVSSRSLQSMEEASGLWNVWAPAVAGAATLTALNAVAQEVVRRSSKVGPRGVSGIRVLEPGAILKGTKAGGFGGLFYEAEKFYITPPRPVVEAIAGLWSGEK